MSRTPSNHPANRAALFTMIGLLLLLAAGAAVNSLGAAHSVPDWPLSYGKLLPFNFTGNATHEQSHRILAVVCLVLVGWLALALRREERAWVRKLGWSVAGLYVVQVILGGLVVLLLSPGWLASLHMVLAQASFVMVFLVVLATSKRWVEREPGGQAPPAPKLIASIAYLALLQVVLGAVSRHPPAGQGVFIASLLAHIAVALALLVLAVTLVVKLGRGAAPRPLKATAMALLILLLIQLLIGMPLFIVAPEPRADEWSAPKSFPYLHIAHVLTAALILAHAAALALRVKRAAA